MSLSGPPQKERRIHRVWLQLCISGTPEKPSSLLTHTQAVSSHQVSTNRSQAGCIQSPSTAVSGHQVVPFRPVVHATTGSHHLSPGPVDGTAMTDCLQNGRRPGWWQGGSGRCPMGGGRVLMSHETDECQAFDASAYRNSTHRHLSRNRPSVLSSVFLAMALFRNCRVTGRQIQSQHLIPSTYLKKNTPPEFHFNKRGEGKKGPGVSLIGGRKSTSPSNTTRCRADFTTPMILS